MTFRCLYCLLLVEAGCHYVHIPPEPRPPGQMLIFSSRHPRLLMAEYAATAPTATPSQPRTPPGPANRR